MIKDMVVLYVHLTEVGPNAADLKHVNSWLHDGYTVESVDLWGDNLVYTLVYWEADIIVLGD